MEGDRDSQADGVTPADRWRTSGSRPPCPRGGRRGHSTAIIGVLLECSEARMMPGGRPEGDSEPGRVGGGELGTEDTRDTCLGTRTHGCIQGAARWEEGSGEGGGSRRSRHRGNRGGEGRTWDYSFPRRILVPSTSDGSGRVCGHAPPELGGEMAQSQHICFVRVQGLGPLLAVPERRLLGTAGLRSAGL